MYIPKSLRRFSKYSGVGVSAFAFDLALLYVLIEFFDVQYLIATALAFAIAISLQFTVNKKYVFTATKQTYGTGYIIAATIAVLGLVLVTSLMYVSVEVFELPYLYSRILIAGVVGIISYLLNLYLNFRVAGIH